MSSVRVRFSECSDITADVTPDTTTSQLKDIIRREKQDETAGRVLRIIHLGKILQDDDLVGDKHILQCSIGGLISDLRPQTNSRTTPVRGFDRLREAGLSETEIEDLRANFNSGETDINAEEAWIDNEETDIYLDVLIGCCIGFFFGFGALFWIFGGKVFSEKKTIAIFAGLLFNILYGLCR